MERGASWTVSDAVAFADIMMKNRYLEVKSVGVEVLACYRKTFTPSLLVVCQRWLGDGHSGNWATTDSICGQIIGPILLRNPNLVARLRSWRKHRSLWVRR